jgi:hypothetical protein
MVIKTITTPYGWNSKRRITMTVEVKLEDGTLVKGTLVKTVKSTISPDDRKYQVLGTTPMSYKSKQRQTIVDILRTKKDHEWTPLEVSKIYSTKGVKVVDGRFLDSTKYHLHQMFLMGEVKVS